MPSELIFTQDGSNPPSPGTNEVTVFAKAGEVYAINTSGLVRTLGAQVNDRVMLEYRMPNNTFGGSATLGVWETRPINQKPLDTSGICTLNANSQFVLPAGTYEARITTNHFATNRTLVRLVNVASPTTALVRSVSSYAAGTTVAGNVTMEGYFILTASATLRIEQRVQTSVASQGMGLPSNFAEDEVHLQAFFRRVAL
jgi:hypothetical protein